jgi:hypothetical protein
VDEWVAPKDSLCLEKRSSKVDDGDGVGIFRTARASSRKKAKKPLVICGKTVKEVRFFVDAPEVGALGYPSFFIYTCLLLLSVCVITQL